MQRFCVCLTVCPSAVVSVLTTSQTKTPTLYAGAAGATSCFVYLDWLICNLEMTLPSPSDIVYKITVSSADGKQVFDGTGAYNFTVSFTRNSEIDRQFLARTLDFIINIITFLRTARMCFLRSKGSWALKNTLSSIPLCFLRQWSNQLFCFLGQKRVEENQNTSWKWSVSASRELARQQT